MHGCFIMPSETVTCTWYFCHWMHSQHSIDLKNAVMERGNCEWCDLFVADNYRRSVVDRSTGQKVILSDEDIAIASSLVKGKYSSPGYNPYEVNICINGLWLCFLTTLWHLLSSSPTLGCMWWSCCSSYKALQYGPHSFPMAGPSTWNSLPAPLRSCYLISAFHRDLKTELFIRAYH